jgi:uncharacterized membrane protein (UPF0127 family)
VNLDELAQRAETQQGWVRRAAWLVFVAGLLAFVVRGSDGPANPALANPARRPLPGFPSIPFQIVSATQQLLDWCALLAANERAREEGLMGQQDLRGYEAMVFEYSEDTETQFYMYGTTIPLTIAWFDHDGSFISSADMEPCASPDPNACPHYPPPARYKYALEVAKGDLGRLGIGPGSKLAFPYDHCV